MLIPGGFSTNENSAKNKNSIYNRRNNITVSVFTDHCVNRAYSSGIIYNKIICLPTNSITCDIRVDGFYAVDVQKCKPRNETFKT